jgi:hypothetical protein
VIGGLVVAGRSQCARIRSSDVSNEGVAVSLPERILQALENLVTLRITTTVVAGTDEKSIVSDIDLLQGDITTTFAKEFVDGGPYESLRAFHQEREKQGNEIIQGNVEALKSLLGLAQAVAGEAPAVEAVAVVEVPAVVEAPGG